MRKAGCRWLDAPDDAPHYAHMRYDEIQSSLQRASVLLKAMSNERRLQILCYLSEGEHSVNELCRLVGLSQSALSQHLAKMRRDGLVQPRREKQTVYYSVTGGEVRRILDTLHELYCPSGIEQSDDQPSPAPPHPFDSEPASKA